MNLKINVEELYLYFYRDLLTKEKTQQEVDFILSKFSLIAGDKIADIPCGFGRHAVEIAHRRQDINVLGLDINSYYLNVAQGDAQHLKNLEIKYGDMKNLSLIEQFKGVFCVYTSFGYFSEIDNEKVLHSFYMALQNEGVLFLEVYNHLKHNQDGDFIFAKKDDNYIIDSNSLDHTTGIQSINRTYIKDGEIYKFNYSIRLYYCTELLALLKKIGFRYFEVYGDYDGQQYSNISDRMIIVAKKIM